MSILKFLIGWPLSIIALFFIVRVVYLRQALIYHYLEELNWFVVLASICCFVCYFLLRSYLWKMILDLKGYPVSFKKTAFMWSSAEIKRFIPGVIWSFLGRTVSFSQEKIPQTAVLSALAIEIQCMIIACVLLSTLSLPLLVRIIFPLNQYQTALIVLGILFCLILILYISQTLLINRLRTYGTKKPLIWIWRLAKFLLPNFATKDILKLLGIFMVSYFFFGLGMYLSISSFVYLNPYLSIQFISFFVLAFLVGYLSLVTPMGLGVREGVITIGLSQVLGASTAGFAAIFARIVLIFSELIFFCSTFIWKNLTLPFESKMKLLLQRNSYETFLVLCILLYIFYFACASFLRYENFYAGKFDLGNMDQTVWNTSQGRIFQLTSPDGIEVVSRLAIHADFILILLSPFYWLWNDPRTLLFLQTVIIATGSVFVYAIARQVIGNRMLSFILSTAYLLNPSLQHSNLYDFHAVTLATTFLLGAWYFLLRKNYIVFGVFCFLAGITKEQVWITISLLGLYVYIKNFYGEKKIKILGLAIFILPVIFFYLLVSMIIPAERGGHHFALSYYSDFGDSAEKIIKNILFPPDKTIFTLTREDRVEYIVKLLTPLGFLPILSANYLIFALPDFLINMLSKNQQLREIYFQYTATITPFLFISTMYAIQFLHKKIPRISYRLVSWYLIFFILYSVYQFGPLPGSKSPNLDMFAKPYPNKKELKIILDQIPAHLSVSATNNLGAHLTRREKIFTVPIGMNSADFVAFLLNDSYALPSLTEQKEMVEHLKENSNYKILYEKNDFIIFEKKKL